MATYKIEMMTKGDWFEYMRGGYNYSVDKTNITAETPEQAIEIAQSQHPDMVINKGYVKSLEEIEAERKAEEEARAKREQEEAERKAKREAAKQRKIERDLAKGITPEMRKAMTYSKRYAKQIKELEAELTELKAKKAHWDKVAEG